MSKKKYRSKDEPGYTETPIVDAATDTNVQRLFQELGGGNLTEALEASVATVRLYRAEIEDRLRSRVERRSYGDDPERRLTISPTVGVRAIRAVADLMKKRAALLEECRLEIAIISRREEAKRAAERSAGSPKAMSPEQCTALPATPATDGGTPSEPTADAADNATAGAAGTAAPSAGETPALRTAEDDSEPPGESS